MDRVGTLKADAYTFQKLWGGIPTSLPPTGTTAAKVTLTADHRALTTDLNDAGSSAGRAGNTARPIVRAE